MTDLRQSLIKAEFSHLKALAEIWQLSFDAPNAREGLDLFVESLLKSPNLSKIHEILTPKEQSALLWLEDRGGKEHWDRFSREYGEIREMGAGKLEREQPYLRPISTTESLWYRALIARGFLETETGVLEFVFIPEDLRQVVIPFLSDSREGSYTRSLKPRVASRREYAYQTKADALILDQLCTLLAGIRMSLDLEIQLSDISEHQLIFYRRLSQVSGMLDENEVVLPVGIKDFFDHSRQDGLLLLWKNWRYTEDFHDIKLVPGLVIEGDPEIKSIRVRDQVLGYLNSLDPGSWWSIESFISQIREINPDLLRKSGEFDTWFIKRINSDEYLKGFEYWDEVEGALLRFIVTGPLHWLGFLDIGFSEEGGDPLAFKLSAYSEALINEVSVPIQLRKPEAIQIRSKGEIRMTDNVPHKTRYQVARFCDWFPIKADAYVYAITPASLSRAEEQGLLVPHLLSLLKKNIEAIPPNILAALERWEKTGVQASIAKKTVLRVGSPQIIKSLKKSKASRYILEQVGPTVVIVKDGSEEKINDALVELGFFLEVEGQTGSQT